MSTRLKNIFFSELTVSFKPQGKFFNSLYFEHPGAKSATTYYRLYYSGYRLHTNTFHNTINKNVNHSNDTIDNLKQSSFHKPARQRQGHLRTESFPALLTFCTAHSGPDAAQNRQLAPKQNSTCDAAVGLFSLKID